MKKVICIILSVLMIVACLSGCSTQKKANNLKVAISPDFAPMEFVDASKKGQDQFVGFDVSLAKYLAKELGYDGVEIMPMSFDACQVAVGAGSCDMSISGYSWTEERAKNYNISDYYYAGDNETEQVIITTKANEGKFKTAADFSGKKVAAQTASLQLDLCNEQLPEDCTIQQVGDLTTAILQLINGDFDAMAVAKGNGEVFINAHPDDLAQSGFQFEVSEEYTANVILLKKGADDLTTKVNAALKKAYDGGMYGPWYDEALKLAESENAQDVTYDESGNVAK